MTHALIIVDAQYDFIWGSMGASDRELAIPYILDRISCAQNVGDSIFASLDWHPKDHCSFKAQGGPFVEHAVHHTYGAGLLPEVVRASKLIRKGTNKAMEALSAFDGTGLAGILRIRDIKAVTLVGYCTEFCVRATALDALRIGFETRVVRKAVRAVDEDAGLEALAEIVSAGGIML